MITNFNAPAASLQSAVFKRFNSNREKCPVCNGARKDCRENTEKQIIHCRAGVDNPSFVNRGMDTLGFGMWVSVSSVEAFKTQNREEWIEHRRKREEAKRQEIASIQSILSRHRDIDIILGQLDLFDSDRRRLNDRGLSDNEIDKLGYKSAVQWQELGGSCLKYGVTERGTLKNPVDCILVPIRDLDGRYVAIRIYNYDAKANDLGKYLSFKGSNLPETGEFPLAIYGADHGGSIVGLAEGMEFKPAIAAHRLGIPIIGASGGNHASSPVQLKEMFAALGAKKVRLFPDAGSLQNSNVLTSYKRTIDLVRSLGCDIEVASWGQVEKSNGDIDARRSLAWTMAEAFNIPLLN